ncbi:MAG: carboxypeptidase M32 [Treponema sp.]|jgi:carboxypeptidase Taq|nr:carboxypeptidase M32 [Treponema sp.]
MKTDASLEKLRRIDREYRYLERALAVLQWDEETCLPPKGVEERAEQLALLQGIAHRRLVTAETGRLLGELGSTTENPRGDEGLPALDRDFLRVMRRVYDREVKLPADFVRKAARAEGLSQAAWAQARRNNDFPSFLPHLSAMIDLARKKARYWGYSDAGEGKGSLYDGLLDIYEPGLRASELSALFSPLQERLTALLKQFGPPREYPFLNQDYDIEAQARFNRQLMDYIGFDQSRGRLDTSAHPFTTSLGSDDIRITTRYFPGNPLSGIFSVIHESGHAFYEMGFPAELRLSCLADGASMAVHESQSRFWENIIGRSRPFWEGLFPILQRHFPRQLNSVDAGLFYQAVNQLRPTLIRVDADEVSYALHIILRFELEKQLIAGELPPEALPGRWREYSRRYLDMESQTDSDGVLQDVHWSMGAFGYFPSYALGNLYGLQFWAQMQKELPDLETALAAGRFQPIRAWLQDRIYRWGCRLSPQELLRQVTGEQLSPAPFLAYVETKYGALHRG